MTEKELHHLNRHDLLQILLMQSRELERLQAAAAQAQEQEERRQAELDQTRRTLSRREEQLEALLRRLDALDAKLDALLAERGREQPGSGLH